jgi:hypothetical protein
LGSTQLLLVKGAQDRAADLLSRPKYWRYRPLPLALSLVMGVKRCGRKARTRRRCQGHRWTGRPCASICIIAQVVTAGCAAVAATRARLQLQTTRCTLTRRPLHYPPNRQPQRGVFHIARDARICKAHSAVAASEPGATPS